MQRGKSKLAWLVLLTVIVVCAGPARGAILLEDPFDYENGSRLSTQLDVAAAGTWFGNSYDDNSYLVLNDDDSGNGTPSLSFPGIAGSGGRLSASQVSGYSYCFYPAPVTGEGNSVYISFLFKPASVANTYIMGNATARSAASAEYPSWPVDVNSTHNELGRMESKDSISNPGSPALVARWRDTGSSGPQGPALTIGQTYFIVMKSTMVAGPAVDNDKVDIFVDPVVGAAEPAPTISSLSDPGDDVAQTSGILGVFLRGATNSGSYELDELRAGTTWEDVTGEIGTRVPNVVGETESAATAAIEAAGLIVGNVTEDYSDTVAAGLVISQAPVADELVPDGSAVDFVVSLGPLLAGTDITASRPNGFIVEGMLLTLTAPAGTGHEWYVDYGEGAELLTDSIDERVTGTSGRVITFNPVLELDGGSYICRYTLEGKETAETPPYVLEVLPPGSLPVASLIGLCFGASACMLGGVLVLRRRKY